MSWFRAHDLMIGHQFPDPLPPTRQIEMMRSKVEMVVPCNNCMTRTARLTCSMCWAVKYCSKECQKKDWKKHKSACREISIFVGATGQYVELLLKEFGGAEEFYNSELVKKGLFNYEGGSGIPRDKYILVRRCLVDGYTRGHGGWQNQGALAFRLAAENMLDVMCLTYNTMWAEKGKRYMYCGMMVAGGMDQEALNLLYYFYHRKQSSEPLPYLDMFKDEDIEGDEYLELMARKEDSDGWISEFQYHDYMLIALIKYKKMQELFVEKQKVEAGWNIFMLGMDPKVGRESVVKVIGSKTLIVEKIMSFVFGDNLGLRIDQLADQIQKLLDDVMEENPKIIPGMINKETIPYPYRDHQGYDFDGDRHEACVANDNYGGAWNMSKSYTKALQLFLDTGRVVVNSGDGSSLPVEGMLQTAFDVDPSIDLGRKMEVKTTSWCNDGKTTWCNDGKMT